MVDLYSLGFVVALIVTDFVTGIVKAVQSDSLSSKVMRVGLWHKFTYFIIIGVGWGIDFEVGHVDLGFDFPVLPMVIVAISLIEITSIFENLVVINPELASNGVLKVFSKIETKQTNSTVSDNDKKEV